jgi:murein DD-endopeptidase MepM/ murein hydrolase activator NlpD
VRGDTKMKWWNRWQGKRESRDFYWQNQTDEPDYSWLKKLTAAVLIFAFVYIAHISDTGMGRAVDDGIRYLITTETDWNYVFNQIIERSPKEWDWSVFKKVQTAVSKPADPLMYMTKPASGKLIAGFGWQTHPVLKQQFMHEGLDIEAPPGTGVRASAPGKIKTITDSAQYGKMIIIEHGQDVETVYGHLSEVLANPGDMVSQGQVIGKVGKTGMTDTPVLYFEVREGGKPVDPMLRIKGDFPVGERK